MDILARIAERRISEAMDQGVFDDLPGKGRPFVFEDEAYIPEDLRLACRILKNAGCIPPELEMRNEIVNLKRLIDTIDDDAERLRRIRELNYRILQLDLMRKRPLHLEAFPEYEAKITERRLSK